MSQQTERILLLTATPHQGNVDQFHNFLRLLDPDQFISDQINPQILRLQDSPWFLRRIKEELKDFQGRKLFKDRHAKTVPFELSYDEQILYKRVTEYINRYLGKTQGRKQASVALARTVLQRRLASSLIAVFSRMRGNKILERLSVQDSNTPHSCDYRYNAIYSSLKNHTVISHPLLFHSYPYRYLLK